MPLVTPLRPDDLRRVGRYRLSGRIADGLDTPNSAGTFLSRLPDGTPVAVTLLARAAAPDPASRDRFSAEATVARRVAPFCAARILDAGFDGDLPFLVSEFIEGPSLAETVAAEGPLEGRCWPRWPSARPPGSPRSIRPGWCTGISGRTMWCSARRAAGRPLQHHAALRPGDPVSGPARLGPDDPVRRGAPGRGQPWRSPRPEWAA